MTTTTGIKRIVRTALLALLAAVTLVLAVMLTASPNRTSAPGRTPSTFEVLAQLHSSQTSR